MKYIVKSIKNKENKSVIVEADFITASGKIYSQICEILIDDLKNKNQNKKAIHAALCNVCDYYENQEAATPNTQDFDEVVLKEIDSTVKDSLVILKDLKV